MESNGWCGVAQHWSCHLPSSRAILGYCREDVRVLVYKRGHRLKEIIGGYKSCYRRKKVLTARKYHHSSAEIQGTDMQVSGYASVPMHGKL